MPLFSLEIFIEKLRSTCTLFWQKDEEMSTLVIKKDGIGL